jgi:hypothetical protein
MKEKESREGGREKTLLGWAVCKFLKLSPP